MHPFICLVALSPLVAALPSPQTSGTRYPWLRTRISDLSVICKRSDDSILRTCNMKFDFYDPNSEPVQEVNGAHCDVSWDWDGKVTERGPKNDFAEGFTICSIAERNLFQVQIERFRSASDWTILVSHKYWDDVHFKAPMNMPNSFTQFEMPKLHPGEEEGEQLGRFQYETGETIEAPVIGLS